MIENGSAEPEAFAERARQENEDNKMRLNKGYKIEEVASEEVNRLSICQTAYYEHDKHTLTATDGRICFRVKVDNDENDVTGIIPCEAIAEARKVAKKFAGAVVVNTDLENVKTLDGRSWPLFKGQYPNCDALIPTAVKNPPLTDSRYVRILFQPELLLALVKASAKDKGGIYLEFMVDDEGDARPNPVILRFEDDSIGAALLMPMRISSRFPERMNCERPQEMDAEHAKAITMDVARTAA